MDILETIVAAKRKEVEKFKPMSSIERFERDGFFWQISNRSLVQSLLLPGSTGIIAEFKRKSPSKGWFKTKELEVEPVVTAYNKSAAGISVITFFTKVVRSISCAISCIVASRAVWRCGILLIAACLSPTEVKELATYTKSIGLESILEIHNEEELDHICDEVDMVGVNNRNLKTFEVNIDTSLQLVSKIPSGKPAIAESGISSIDAIVTLRNAGFKGFLMYILF